MQAKHRLYSSAIGMLAGAIALLTNSTIGVAVLLITGAMFLRSFYDSSRADRM